MGGVPVFPVEVPGAAVSPGTRICNTVKALGATVAFALVLAVSVPLVSVAVIVRVPAVLKVRLGKMRVPETSVRFPAVALLSSAMVALLSELLRLILGVAPATRFQFASTARTMMPLAMRSEEHTSELQSR